MAKGKDERHNPKRRVARTATELDRNIFPVKDTPDDHRYAQGRALWKVQTLQYNDFKDSGVAGTYIMHKDPVTNSRHIMHMNEALLATGGDLENLIKQTQYSIYELPGNDMHANNDYGNRRQHRNSYKYDEATGEYRV